MTVSNDGPSSPAVRPITRADLPAIRAVIASNDLFPSEMLDDMAAGFFGPDETEDHWFTVDDGEPVAIAYFAPERLTSGTWNLYLIAVRADRQGQGFGGKLLKHIETYLASRGERVLLVETSGLPAFEATRAFYHRRGFTQEATIRDFYQAGEDKIVFWKSLRSG